jgi:hypothetical protein
VAIASASTVERFTAYGLIQVTRSITPGLPLWLKSNFRRHVFWATNKEHLDLLERVIRAQLRARPIIDVGKLTQRFTTNRQMPFNLPSWILSAKNRPDLLRRIKRLRQTIPKNVIHDTHQKLTREQLLDQLGSS